MVELWVIEDVKSKWSSRRYSEAAVAVTLPDGNEYCDVCIYADENFSQPTLI
jgi:hypothetical protein